MPIRVDAVLQYKADVAERRARKEATQSRILEAARLHFERDGFEAASIRSIASTAGVASGTVLLHFADKASLLHAALHDDLESAIARCLVEPSEGSLLQRLCDVARPFYAYYESRPRLSKVLLRESLLAESPWKERFAEQAQRVIQHVTAIAEAARSQGEIDPKLSTELLATAFASFYYFVLIGWVQQGITAPMSIFEALLAQHLAPYSSARPAGRPRKRKTRK